MPGLLHNLGEARTLWPKVFKAKTFKMRQGAIQFEEEQCMIGAFRRKSGEIMIRKSKKPMLGGENTIKPFKSWAVTLIRPCKSATPKLNFL